MNYKIKTYCFAAGGTGGHLYPAIAVAELLRETQPEAKIFFVGTKGKIEESIVPQSGFEFKSISIAGIPRKISLKMIAFPFKLIAGLIKSLLICIKEKPDVVIGAGAYVSWPVVWAASLMGSKVVLLEQNSYPGFSNRLLERKADAIFLSFESSKQYFRQQDKLHFVGNPLRASLTTVDMLIAKKHFNLELDKNVLLVLGGSLGAGKINEAISKCIDKLKSEKIQVIWQTGKYYYEKYKSFESKTVKVLPFIADIKYAYAASDLIVARSGATTIAEAALLSKAVVFVPSPNVAGNHQYFNAKSLEDDGAAFILTDDEIEEKLIEKVKEIIFNDEILLKLAENIKKFAKPDAAKLVVEGIVKLAESKIL